MEDLGIIIAVVGVGVALVGVVIAMMFWARTEANRVADIQSQDRKDILSLIEAIKEDGRNFRQELRGGK